MNIMKCPHCKTSVVPTNSGECPACRTSPEWEHNAIQPVPVPHEQNTITAEETFYGRSLCEKPPDVLSASDPVIVAKSADGSLIALKPMSLEELERRAGFILKPSGIREHYIALLSQRPYSPYTGKPPRGSTSETMLFLRRVGKVVLGLICMGLALLAVIAVWRVQIDHRGSVTSIVMLFFIRLVVSLLLMAMPFAFLREKESETIVAGLLRIDVRARPHDYLRYAVEHHLIEQNRRFGRECWYASDRLQIPLNWQFFNEEASRLLKEINRLDRIRAPNPKTGKDLARDMALESSKKLLSVFFTLVAARDQILLEFLNADGKIEHRKDASIS